MTDMPVDIEGKLKAVIRRIEEAAAFDGVMGENFNASTSLKALARLSCMSERSLRDWFKRYTGESVSKYAKRRRTEYAARILRLFPNTPKSMVSEIIGLNSSNALYPFMRRNGVVDIDDLINSNNAADVKPLKFRFEYLPDCVMFYMQTEIRYEECSSGKFEVENWDKIDVFLNQKFPNAVKIGDVGFAIDRYVENNLEEGIFISGILCKNILKSQLSRDLIGDIGWRYIPCQKYAVFIHRGCYEELTDFYCSVLQILRQRKDIQVDKPRLVMEKYLNSPAEMPAEELITEIWVPVF